MNEELKKIDASDTYPPRINAEVVLISKKSDEFVFLFTNGTAKLSGRDYEFREPTVTLKPTVKREDFSRELQGESGESQPTTSTDE